MYDVVVIGQGLTGMLSAIWAKEHGYRTALVATGSGKILQSIGVLDLIPGANGGLKEWSELYQLAAIEQSQLTEAMEQFKVLTKRIGYPYKGNIEHLVPIVTGSGHIKQTALYPETISPIKEHGQVIIVGFDEVIDFQPAYIKGNLQKSRPQLSIDTIKISLGKQSQRTMTQLDAARILDQKENRDHCIKQIKQQMAEREISQPDLFIFPASLGVENWTDTLEQFTKELGANVTEAPGMPPNTTAIRLHEKLKKEAIKLGVRFYVDTTVVGCKMDGPVIESLTFKTSNHTTNVSGKQFILATGGILGGGLEVTSDGVRETALKLAADANGQLIHCPENLYPVGAARGSSVTHNGITGGVYSVLSSHEMVGKLHQQAIIGGFRSA
ncbi:FAD-binding protein [Neobacillus vireti]|uniref:Anaerobic glycerol-3-phosphate dehydrogenase subunit B n=1 Tax=Neobacillus vireti LMG 21834 TaxID=1131730 RepID=A0AB94IJG8_9BACI|nr:FAD-binding protein [Neobacillus vireti]ETI67241.1 anaerobic glycerol-3-phosphate dehydrogenase subunit B [Neobacillus vireti LMG 21834]KLT17928.1 glycerol-3-phosphate dehydrogenase [Neobacillus vireti]